MPGALELTGAAQEPSSFAALHTDRIFTGFWPNRSVMRDGATTEYELRYGLGRQDSIWLGYNCEISPYLTLIRRAGLSVYNQQSIPPVTSFYSFHTFTLTSEAIRVLADTASVIYDVTGLTGNTVVMNKAAGAGRAYFLGVGNTLYITDGVENKQWHYATSQLFDWGINAPANAPTVTQALRPNPYSSWLPNTGYTILGSRSITILDNFANWQQMVTVGLTGSAVPSWSPAVGGITQDNQVQWKNIGGQSWAANTAYTVGTPMRGAVDPTDPSVTNLFWCIQAGTSGAGTPGWIPGLGNHVSDGGVVWENGGVTQTWSQQTSVTYINQDTILDPSGYIQKAAQYGRTGATPPTFQTGAGAATQDATVLWKNSGAYAIAGTAPIQYGYAYKNSVTTDISNMSPPSAAITVTVGNQVTVTGAGSTQAGADTVIIYRTLTGGAILYHLAEIPMPPAGQQWTYTDNNLLDTAVNQNIPAMQTGEGTPLPAGAGPMAYHLGRIFVGVGNVVWVSSGPDVSTSGSSGNAGFDQFFTLQSKVTRFWVTTLGLVVFTVRDCYILRGSATDADPLYATVFIANLPLLSYDCFSEYLTIAYLYIGTRMVVKLDPSAGISEVSFPIANYLLDDADNHYDPKSSYLSFLMQDSRETSLTLANGSYEYLRMNLSNAPENGSNWNPPATITNGTSAVQAVEVDNGIFRLLVGSRAAGPILQRDRTVATDNGYQYSARAQFGSVRMADPGKLAGLAWITLTSATAGTAPALEVLIGEISGTFESVPRTRQDPPDLPPSTSVRNDRHHLLQNQNPVWCQHFQFAIDWPAENAFNELMAFTIYGQQVQEMKGS